MRTFFCRQIRMWMSIVLVDLVKIKWCHCYLKVMSSQYVTSPHIQEHFGAYFKLKMQKLMVSRKNNSLFVWAWDRKICPLGSQFVITRQTSWCQMVIFETDYSFPQSHTWSTVPHSAVGNMSDCRSRGREFNPSPSHTFAEIDHEIILQPFSSLPLIQEGLLSLTNELCVQSTG